MSKKKSKNVYFSRDVALREGYKLLNEDGPYLTKKENGRHPSVASMSSPISRAEEGIEKAEKERKRNNYKKEIEFLKKALKYKDRDPEIYWLIANAYTRLENHIKAIEYYGEIINLKDLRISKLGLAYYNIAVVYECSSKIQLAIENYNNAGEIFFKDREVDYFIKAIKSIARLDSDSKYIINLIDMSKDPDYEVVHKYLEKFINRTKD